MKRITISQIIELHEYQISNLGGQKGLRDSALLDAAVNAPFQTFMAGGKSWKTISPFPDVQSKAARLAYGIIRNHPFFDGNKRTGIQAMFVFLDLNQIIVESSEAEVVALGLAIADGSLDVPQIREWIVRHEISGGFMTEGHVAAGG